MNERIGNFLIATAKGAVSAIPGGGLLAFIFVSIASPSTARS